MNYAPWERPYECDDWRITTSYRGKSLIRRRDQWRATAVGYRERHQHAVYQGITTEAARGRTRAEAEADMRRIICRDIKSYEKYLGVRRFESTHFSASDICPC